MLSKEQCRVPDMTGQRMLDQPQACTVLTQLHGVHRADLHDREGPRTLLLSSDHQAALLWVQTHLSVMQVQVRPGLPLSYTLWTHHRDAPSTNQEANLQTGFEMQRQRPNLA